MISDIGSQALKTLQLSLTQSQKISKISGDFNKLLKASLTPDKSNKVNEEELFASLSQERVQSLKGDDSAKSFADLLATEENKLKKPNGYVPVEQATINTLKKMVSSGALTTEEGDAIYSQAFQAAQLDSNKKALYDSLGGPRDATVAMATLDVALQGAHDELQKLIDGKDTLTQMKLADASANGKSSVVKASGTVGGAVTPKGNAVDGAGGFLFKPVSDHGGNLAVLLGQAVTGNISSVLIKDSLNKIIEKGKLSTAGTAETGREKWNFSKSGSEYPKNITVEVTQKDGKVTKYKIADPSQRYD